jgi:hypothetical protein
MQRMYRLIMKRLIFISRVGPNGLTFLHGYSEKRHYIGERNRAAQIGQRLNRPQQSLNGPRMARSYQSAPQELVQALGTKSPPAAAEFVIKPERHKVIRPIVGRNDVATEWRRRRSGHGIGR